MSPSRQGGCLPKAPTNPCRIGSGRQVPEREEALKDATNVLTTVSNGVPADAKQGAGGHAGEAAADAAQAMQPCQASGAAAQQPVVRPAALEAAGASSAHLTASNAAVMAPSGPAAASPPPAKASKQAAAEVAPLTAAEKAALLGSCQGVSTRLAAWLDAQFRC